MRYVAVYPLTLNGTQYSRGDIIAEEDVQVESAPLSPEERLAAVEDAVDLLILESLGG